MLDRMECGVETTIRTGSERYKSPHVSESRVDDGRRSIGSASTTGKYGFVAGSHTSCLHPGLRV